MRVLFVTDDIATGGGIAAGLLKENIETEVAILGVDIVDNALHDIVMVDLNTAPDNREDCLKFIRSLNGTPLLILSTHREMANDKAAIRQPNKKFLPKDNLPLTTIASTLWELAPNPQST